MYKGNRKMELEVAERREICGDHLPDNPVKETGFQGLKKPEAGDGDAGIIAGLDQEKLKLKLKKAVRPVSAAENLDATDATAGAAGDGAPPARVAAAANLAKFKLSVKPKKPMLATAKGVSTKHPRVLLNMAYIKYLRQIYTTSECPSKRLSLSEKAARVVFIISYLKKRKYMH